MGGRKLNSYENSLLTLAEMTSIRDNARNELKELYNRIPDENRDLKIYFDKVYFYMSNAKLELKYGIGRRQIQKIIKKVKKR